MTDFTQMPFNWAGEQAISEAEAFEKTIKSTNIKKTEFQTNDVVEQAFREGYLKGVETAQKEALDRFNSILEENISLRRQLKTIDELNNRLRETIRKGQEDYYE